MDVLSAEDAYGNLSAALRDRSFRFPRKDEAGFRDGAIFPNLTPRFRIEPSQTVFTIGSCFARGIENLLQRKGFDVPVARFEIPDGELPQAGTHLLNEYNAGTILQRLESAVGAFVYQDEMGVERTPKGLLDLFLHVHAKPVDAERLIARRHEIADLYGALLRSQTVIITLGLIECWYDSAFDCYLNKAPSRKLIEQEPGRFVFHRFGVGDVVDRMTRAIELLNQRHTPNILLTVSPIPMEATFSGDDAVIANGYSKSVLRVAAEQLRRRFANVDYFPSYEIVLSAGSPGFEDDNVHVNASTTIRITEHMVDFYMGDAAPVQPAAPVEPQALYQLAMAAIFEIGDLAGAHRLATMLVTDHPAQWLGLDVLGHYHSKIDDHATAADYARRALALAPNHWGLVVRLGHAEEALGNRSEAERLLRRGVEIGGDAPGPRQFLDAFFRRNPPAAA